MTEIPEKPAYNKDHIAEWYSVAKQMAALKSKEHLLRLRLAAFFFPEPKEGTNKVPIPEGQRWHLKMKHVLNRTVDEAALMASREDLTTAGVSVDKIIKYKPELAKSEYNKLTDEQKKLVDRCLTIKPGTPQLELWISAADKKAIESLNASKEQAE